VTAAEGALNDLREQARVGQRTTLDVLNAQQGLGERPRGARHRATRSCRGVLHRAGGHRRALAASSR
jgi:hypothetical protein